MDMPDGQTRQVITNPFGFYSFDEIQVGQSYTLTVTGKGLHFANPTQVITVNADLLNLDFVADL